MNVIRFLCWILLVNVPLLDHQTADILTVKLPITGENAQALQKTLERLDAQTLVLQFKVPNGEELNAAQSSFGACYEIAQILTGEKFFAVRTVAYIPQDITGHALLVTFACKERFIATDAELKPGFQEHQQKNVEKQAYLEIAKRKNIALAIIEKMFDRKLPLVHNDTALSNDTDASEGVVIPAGQDVVFSAALARQIGLADLITDDKNAVAAGLGVQSADLLPVTVRTESGKAVRVPLNGLLTQDKVNRTIRSIRNHLENQKADFLCLEIDSPGGDLNAAVELAAYLKTIAEEEGGESIRTVAYVPHQARSDAALIAATCSEVVLGENAVFGGGGAREYAPEQIEKAVHSIADAVPAESLRKLFIEPAVQIDGLPIHTVKDFNELKVLYKLDGDIDFVQPGWADNVVQRLSTPEMSVLLIFIVWIGIMVEAKTPGIGIGAFAAIISIVLFFWLNILGGTAGWLEIMLFLAGIGCLLFEIFVLPGFGIFGIGGIAAMLAALVLASQTFVIPHNAYQFAQLQHTLMMLVVCGLGVFACGYFFSKVLDRYVKKDDNELIAAAERLVHYDFLLHERGITATPLVPAGKAVIDGQEYDVVSAGSFIEKGIAVEVRNVVGYKITVDCYEF